MAVKHIRKRVLLLLYLMTNDTSFPSLLKQSISEPESPALLPPSPHDIEELSDAVEGLTTVEEVMRYLEPEQWQVDMDELYKPTWHVLGKSFIHNKKARGRMFLIGTTKVDIVHSEWSIYCNR